jgi:16S rRNA (cytosine967-C5)-methyltransferase
MGKIKRRFIRAGVTNVQYHRSEESLNRIALGKMNWVIVDAPSTCTGVIRRNPDIKLKFTHNFLQSKVELQRKMVGKALKFMHRNGRLVYIT